MPRTAHARRALGALAKAAQSASPATGEVFAATQHRLFSSLIQGGSVATNSALAKARCPCHGSLMCTGRNFSTVSTPVMAEPATADEAGYDPMCLAQRHHEVLKHFPKALGVDDFMSRAEIALAGYGFTGDNTIAMSNLCRDESCMVLEDKIESVFGSCFSTHGLGGVLTCGVIGMKAGLSHSPVIEGKERYVFFSFPHIAIDSNGQIGAISRPNRPDMSAACGALIACLGDLKKEGLQANIKVAGTHDPLEPEYSILKKRIAIRLNHEGVDPAGMNLVDITKAAERTITSDLEYLIHKAVDPSRADYAVFTGVQVHNWSADLTSAGTPSLEFISVGKSYIVTNGEKHYLDMGKVPALSPRQLRLLAHHSGSTDMDHGSSGSTSTSMLQEIPRNYLMRRLGGAAGSSKVAASISGWQDYVKTTWEELHPNAPRMDDHLFESEKPPKEDVTPTSFTKANANATPVPPEPEAPRKKSWFKWW